MKIHQRLWQRTSRWDHSEQWQHAPHAQLVLVFGPTELLDDRRLMGPLQSAYPIAAVVGCSTAGEIRDTRVLDESLVATAIFFERTAVRATEVYLADAGSSTVAGEMLGAALAADGLVHVLVLSDGLKVNGSELVRGLTRGLPPTVAVTGGLSGDGDRFAKTVVYLNGSASEGRVVAIGLYSEHLRVGYGSLGGWDPFGPERRITRSRANVLYELDGRSALAMYKKYLGPHAAGLPLSGLQFPLAVRAGMHDTPVVRTILSIDEQQQSVTFAGDVPEGMYARLMRANFDRLLDGATGAAQTSRLSLGNQDSELAILISCVGRKLFLRQRIEEEVESVRAVLGTGPTITGFYSYGEMSPFTPTARCEFHNQTMTITVLSEAA